MELLIDSLVEGISREGLFIFIISFMAYGWNRERNERKQITTESQKNLVWYQAALDKYQSTIDRLL
ncbi:MAG: hypothetical protein COA36_16925 [Desulfotalea sp.]|nr:MAG: hypothetical protein COA36_16925 [Desulfotalea sp.]